MLNRIFQLNKEIESSIFLFGGRQTGKTTILRQQFPDAIFFDLLSTRCPASFSTAYPDVPFHVITPQNVDEFI